MNNPTSFAHLLAGWNREESTFQRMWNAVLHLYPGHLLDPGPEELVPQVGTLLLVKVGSVVTADSM